MPHARENCGKSPRKHLEGRAPASLCPLAFQESAPVPKGRGNTSCLTSTLLKSTGKMPVGPTARMAVLQARLAGVDSRPFVPRPADKHAHDQIGRNGTGNGEEERPDERRPD